MSDPLNAPRELDWLVAQTLDGDRSAANTLVRVIRPLVVRYCRSRLGAHERVNVSPDDVAQEACLAVLRALPSYRDQGRPFLAFVYGIAQHKVIDAHRDAGRDRSDPVAEPPEEQDVRDGPEKHALDISDSREMATLLARLPEKQREILRMRVVIGLSLEETAEAVGTTPRGVQRAQHQALAELRYMIASPGLRTRQEIETGAMVATPGAEPPREDQESGIEAFIDEVLAETEEEDAETKLRFEIEGVDPKEFKTYNAVVDGVRSLVNVDAAIAQVVDRYRHRQVTKDIGALSGPLDAGIAAAIAARKRGPARSDEPQVGEGGRRPTT